MSDKSDSVKADFDIAVVGSGFAGSLIAMIARRLGRSVVMIERGQHPRFAIGESSTPLANLLLEELAERYDLPGVRPLCKWGAWQQSLSHIGCGLKRGFTFFRHEFGQPVSSEMLVAASPRDVIADTHWYRPDFDKHLVEEAQRLGVEYLDRTSLTSLTRRDKSFILKAQHGPEIRAGFLLDASGPRGFLHRKLNLAQSDFPDFPKTQALFAHFSGVEKWAALHGSSDRAPYPPDHAAVHHIFDGGWIWVLRFNNGLTSAGAVMTDELAAELRLHEGAPAWARLLDRLPSVREQFVGAIPATPFIHQPRVAFRSASAAGARWAMLPSAAGVVDPLLSTGFPLTLLGIERLARIIEDGFPPRALAEYERQTFSELDATAALVAALYANMRDFETFSALTLLYFAAASFSESARRLHRPDLARSFLLHDDPRFGPALQECCRAPSVARIREAIEPFDVAGLGRRERHPYYPALAGDFMEAAHKLGASRAEATEALARAGFSGISDASDASDSPGR